MQKSYKLFKVIKIEFQSEANYQDKKSKDHIFQNISYKTKFNKSIILTLLLDHLLNKTIKVVKITKQIKVIKTINVCIAIKGMKIN